jgi:RNA polymerase sigma-70 factor (ECF subfamily)
MSQTPFDSTVQGNFACVAAAWAAHESALRGYLRVQLLDGHAAEDMLQDVFVKAMRQGQGFCRLDNPRAWLFQVARNALVDRARGAKVHVALDDVGIELAAPQPEPVAPVDALVGCVARVLGEMSADDAAILRACDLEGQTRREYAERNGLRG